MEWQLGELRRQLMGKSADSAKLLAEQQAKYEGELSRYRTELTASRAALEYSERERSRIVADTEASLLSLRMEVSTLKKVLAATQAQLQQATEAKVLQASLAKVPPPSSLPDEAERAAPPKGVKAPQPLWAPRNTPRVPARDAADAEDGKDMPPLLRRAMRQKEQATARQQSRQQQAAATTTRPPQAPPQQPSSPATRVVNQAPLGAMRVIQGAQSPSPPPGAQSSLDQDLRNRSLDQESELFSASDAAPAMSTPPSRQQHTPPPTNVAGVSGGSARPGSILRLSGHAPPPKPQPASQPPPQTFVAASLPPPPSALPDESVIKSAAESVESAAAILQ